MRCSAIRFDAREVTLPDELLHPTRVEIHRETLSTERSLEHTFDVHETCGTVLGGVHFEKTGEDVTECIGGAAGVTMADLGKNYSTACDPRLNYRQALEMGFRIAKRLGRHPAPRVAFAR